MTGTQIFNHAYYAVLAGLTALSAIPTEVLDILPPKIKPWVAGMSIFGMWLRGARNLFKNPNGTPAQAPWEPPK